MQNPTLAERKKALEQFLNWLNRQFPGSKTRILAKANITSKTLQGLGQDETSPYFVGPPTFLAPSAQVPATNWFDNLVTKITDTAAQVLPAYANYEIQKDAYKIQLERARQGQPPLDLTRYGPSVRVEHGLTTGVTKETENMLWIGGGIIALLFLLNN